jgi:hypothetical protein
MEPPSGRVDSGDRPNRKEVLMKTTGFILPQLILCHIEFVDDLLKVKCISQSQAMELLDLSLRHIPSEVKAVLLPLNREIFQAIALPLREGLRHIAVFTDEDGKRFVAASPRNAQLTLDTFSASS